MRFMLVFVFMTAMAWAHEGRDYFIPNPSKAAMDKVADEFEVLRKTPEGFAVYVPDVRLSRFMALAPAAKAIPDSQLKSQNLAGYRTYESVGNELRALAQQYPELVKLETYGNTRSNHTLYALKVSDNVNVDEDEPELMITSATHGDELISVEVTMDLLLELLRGYGTNERLTKMLNENEIYFIPMVNPQGYASRSRYATGFTDPNRDYPYPEVPNRSSVDCIDSLMKFFHAHNIKGSLDVHAFGKMVMFPWAYTKTSPAVEDERSFQYLVNSMAEQNSYAAGQISKVIYVAKGSSADYYYWKNKTVAIAVELSTSKAPPYGQVASIVNEAREMYWRFIENF